MAVRSSRNVGRNGKYRQLRKVSVVFALKLNPTFVALNWSSTGPAWLVRHVLFGYHDSFNLKLSQDLKIRRFQVQIWISGNLFPQPHMTLLFLKQSVCCLL